MRVSAILLLFILSMPVLSKLGLWIYFFSNRNKIAQTLCVNKDIPDSCCKGKCFLGSQLKKVEEPVQTPAQTPIPSIKFKEFAAELIITNYQVPLFSKIKSLPWPDKIFTVLPPHLSSIFHPPEV